MSDAGTVTPPKPDACAGDSCNPPPSCSDTGPESPASECAAAHRTCEDHEGGAECGGCVAGYRLEGDACVDEKLCGGRECTIDEVPLRDGASCTCVPRECTEDEAERPDGRCQRCEITCDGAGETGQHYPRTDAAGACLCETKPGFFLPVQGGSEALPCDEDQDGFVNAAAGEALQAADPIVREIAAGGCGLSEAPRVDCNDTDASVNPSVADGPDAQNLDSNCDGIDGDLSRSVFVSAALGDDQRDGRTPGQAVSTLARGLELAAACAASACDVLVAEGEYAQSQTLRLANGVSVYGGYTSRFERSGDASAVRISGTANPLVLAERIDRVTTVDRLTLRGANAVGPSEESVTLRIVDSATANALSFTHDIVEAGNGGHGFQGGNGGVTGCFAAGGNGATSFDCGSNQGGRGNAGGDPQRDGFGGNGGNAYCVNACPLVGGDGVSWGSPGQQGGAGNHAAPGPQDGNRVGGFSNQDWLPSTAPSGNRGEHGTGGGGGGSGGTKRFRACFNCGTLLGGVGGNGGNGGCGGAGGGGGGQGGASIGVVVFRSSVSFAGTQIQRGNGGMGGRGGSGSAGSAGAGGASGEGTRNQRCGLINYNSGGGGNGGAGGNGGSGSGGAGGNGGPAIGVALVAGSALTAAPSVHGGNGGAGGGGGNGGGGAAVGPGGQPGDVRESLSF